MKLRNKTIVITGASWGSVPRWRGWPASKARG